MLSALSTGDILSIVLFIGICVTLMFGYPIALTLAGTSIIVAVLGHALGAFDYSILNGVPSRYLGSMTNDVLVAVPLFIFMGLILERSGIAEQLLTTMGQLFGRLRGGLAYSVIIVGALLAASTGVVGATVITMGLIALPTMLRAGYANRVSTGVICGSATLAQIIPPSTVLIFVGDLLAGINQEAQLRRGNYTPDPISVGDLFAGALIPGFMMVSLYLLWIVYKAIFQPSEVPAIKMTDAERAGLSWRVVSALIPPLLLVLAVLGSILLGFATPSESASVGAIGAMILAGLNGRMSFATLRYASMNTMMTTSVIFVIVMAASLFSLVFRGLGGEHMVEEALKNVPGGINGALFVVLFIMFILGFFLDTFEIILIMLPVCGPALLTMGVDPVWLGILIGVNLQTSFLTPPFGFTLFYMRSIAPPTITTGEIWIGSISWTWLQVFALGLVWAFPGTATWLPKYLFSSSPPAIHAPQTPGSGSAPGAPPRSIDRRGLDSSIIGGGVKFDKDGMPIESDDPTGLSNRPLIQNGGGTKFDKDGIPIETDNPFASPKR